jgi:hypothetical protein
MLFMRKRDRYSRNCGDESATADGARIASVIHLAAYIDLTGEPKSEYDELTVTLGPTSELNLLPSVATGEISR